MDYSVPKTRDDDGPEVCAPRWKVKVWLRIERWLSNCGGLVFT